MTRAEEESSIVIPIHEITRHLLEDFPCGTLSTRLSLTTNNVEEDFHEDASHCLWKGV